MPKKELLHFDDSLLFYSSIGKGGTKESELKALTPKLIKAFNHISELERTEEQGFLSLPFDKKNVVRIKALSQKISKQFKTLIVLGIGGSNLGAQAVIEALEAKKMKVIFIDNPDPDNVHSILSTTNWSQTALCAISKSGGTLETISLFLIFQKALIKSVGQKNHVKHIVINTGTNGNLRDIANREGYETLDHPENVGGRFSVLSNVGLFPCACAGLDITELLNGAATIAKKHKAGKVLHISALFAAHHYLGYMKRDKHIHIFMPYAKRLHSIGLWYRQLWAESLGKQIGKNSVGPHPVLAQGATDQHSQVQLYQNGPKNHLITFVEVKNFNKKISIPASYKDIDAMKYMYGHTLSEVMHAERIGTAEALAKNNHPNSTIHIDEISEETIGALLFFYELATAYMGELFGIDAYNQPGVEHGKIIAKTTLDENKKL